MDVSDYRQRFAAELEAAAQQQTSFRDLVQQSTPGGLGMVAGQGPGLTAEDDVTAAAEVVQDKGRPVQLRMAAMNVISVGLGAHPELLDYLLKLLPDQSEPEELRLAALGVLQQSSFQVASAGGDRPEYLAVLRSVVDDPSPDIRRRVIGVLAREKDEYVQRRLVEGLEDPSKALVPAAKAIQFLGYDVHAEYFPLLRRIVSKPPNLAAKREAVRLLSSDPASKDLLTQLLGDRSESRDVRNLSAIALQSVAPAEFHQQAKDIALDDSEDDQLRTAVVTALTHFSDADSLREDGEFTQRMQRLRTQSKSPQLKRATQGYITKVGS
jgi:HEAT repeat protein